MASSVATFCSRILAPMVRITLGFKLPCHFYDTYTPKTMFHSPNSEVSLSKKYARINMCQILTFFEENYSTNSS